MWYWLYVVDSSFFFFKQKTAYEMRISDWSSDVCLPISCAALRQRRQERYPARNRDRRTTQVQVRNGRRGQQHAIVAARYRKLAAQRQIGRASCRERVCQYV